MKKSSTPLANILFPEAEKQKDFADGVLSIPPELRKLHTETYDFTVETLVEKLRSQSVFIPSFQRRYVWTDAQASRLIESLIIQCPIPVIYLNQESDERLSVIDGNQRLTSILRYLEDGFPLKSLTAYPELEGLRFSELDGRFQRHIVNRTLRCIVILKDTHPQVKFDVFERLNTGAVRLTPQELRHGLYFGDAIDLAKTVVSQADLLKMLELKTDKRMKAEELVLRFWALDEGLEDYRKPLASFINQFAEANRRLPDQKKAQLLDNFIQTLAAVHALFGSLAFKVFAPDLSVKSEFNAALFDAEMVGLSRLIREGKLRSFRAGVANQILASAIESDEPFRNSISRATSDESQVRLRIAKVMKLFGK